MRIEVALWKIKTMWLNTLLSPIGKFLLPGDCYEEVWVNFNWYNIPCWKAAISRMLGLGIIAGSVMVKIPQLLKIHKAKSGEGINFNGVALELIAVTASFIYGFRSGFPFSSYGESVFLLLQTWAIGFLVLEYNGRRNDAILYSSVYVGATAMCLSSFFPNSVLWIFQASVVPNVSLARITQIATNYNNCHTGQLSAITSGLLFTGSLARIATSFQETGDALLILTYVVSSALNGVVVGQLIYYWNNHPPVVRMDDMDVNNLPHDVQLNLQEGKRVFKAGEDAARDAADRVDKKIKEAVKKVN